MVNEINNGEGDPVPSRVSVPPLRDYRAALAGGKKQDLASQILKDQVARSFDIKRSQLSCEGTRVCHSSSGHAARGGPAGGPGP